MGALEDLFGVQLAMMQKRPLSPPGVEAERFAGAGAAGRGGVGPVMEVLPPQQPMQPLGVISPLQRARLGPMLQQLEKLGATQDQIRTFSPSDAYHFIRARQGQ